MPNSQNTKAVEKPEDAARPCLESMPYRALVFARMNGNDVPLYWIAGMQGGPWNAINGLKKAVALHGADCLYCGKTLSATEATIDHIDGRTGDAANAIQNLAIACKPCNQKKGHQPIDAFHPAAGKAWLESLHAQIEDRLRRLG